MSRSLSPEALGSSPWRLTPNGPFTLTLGDVLRRRCRSSRGAGGPPHWPPDSATSMSPASPRPTTHTLGTRPRKTAAGTNAALPHPGPKANPKRPTIADPCPPSQEQALLNPNWLPNDQRPHQFRGLDRHLDVAPLGVFAKLRVRWGRQRPPRSRLDFGGEVACEKLQRLHGRAPIGRNLQSNTLHSV